MKTTEITLLIFDTKENFGKPQIQMQYGGDTLFKKLVCFTTQVEFKNCIEQLNPDDYFIVVCHVNYEDYSGFFNFRNTNIQKDYNLENNVIYVSSGDSGEVMNRLFKEYKISQKVVLYSELISSIERDSIKPLLKNDLDIKETKFTEQKKGIFLSHSSADKDVVLKFRDLILIQGLQYDKNLIKFTSDEGTGVPGGIDIPTDLEGFLVNETGLFIQFLSENYEKSRVCLNEEGAGWVLCNNLSFIPIFLPGYSHDNLAWIKSNSKGIKLSDKESLMNIYQNRKSFFTDEVNVTGLSQNIDSFIGSL